MPREAKLTDENLDSLIKEIDNALVKKEYKKVNDFFKYNIEYNNRILDETFSVLFKLPKEFIHSELVIQKIYDLIKTKHNTEILCEKLRKVNLKYRNIKSYIKYDILKTNLEIKFSFEKLINFINIIEDINLVSRIFDEIKKNNQEDKLVHLNIGCNLCDKEQYHQAIKTLHEGIKISESSDTTEKYPGIDIYLYYNLGYTYYRIKNFENSKKYLFSALELDPKNIEACYYIGMILSEEDKFEEAIEMFCKGIKLSKSAAAKKRKPHMDSNLHYELGNAYYKIGNFEKSEEYLRSALKINLKHIKAYCQLGDILLKKNMVKEAIEILTEGIKISNSEKSLSIDSDLYYNLGYTYYKIENFDKAKEYLSSTLNLNPKHIRAYYYLGSILSINNRSEEAIEILSKGIKIRESNSIREYTELNYLLGFNYLKIGNFDKAKEYLRSALKLNPNHAESYIQLGILLMKESKADQAITMFYQATKIDKTNIVAYSNLGAAYIKENKFDEAVKCLLDGFALDPKDPTILHNIAYAYSHKGDLEIALSYLMKAMKADVFPSESYQTMGIILINQNKYKESIIYLNKHLEFDPNCIFTQYSLAIAYLEIEDIENGLYWLKQSADQEVMPALLHLGVMYFVGMLVDRNINKAKKLFAKAEIKGSEKAGKIMALISESENIDNQGIRLSVNTPTDHLITDQPITPIISKDNIQDRKIEDTNSNDERDIQAEINKIIAETQKISLKKYIERKSEKELHKKPKVYPNNGDQKNIKEGFYRVSHHNNMKSSLFVKIDEKLSESCKYMSDFEETAKKGKFVGGIGKQGYKFIGKKTLELKILGGKGKGNQRLWGEIVKDKLTGEKTCILSHYGKHSK